MQYPIQNLEWRERFPSTFDEHVHSLSYGERMRPIVVWHVTVVLAYSEGQSHQHIIVHTNK